MCVSRYSSMPPASDFTFLMTEVVIRKERYRCRNSEKNRLFCTFGFHERRLLRAAKKNRSADGVVLK